jgi:hypothetical protein
MSVSFKAMGSDAANKERFCKNTLEKMNCDLSRVTETVICLIDAQDYRGAKEGQRGFFCLLPKGRDEIPNYCSDFLVYYDESTREWRCHDSAIYIHGSTSSSKIGLTLTLVHELQHYVQYTTNRRTWVIDRLLQALRPTHQEEFRQSADFPIERESRVVSKRIAIELHGRRAVEEFIRQRRALRKNEEDILDCDFLLSSEADLPCDATKATEALVERFRSELIALRDQYSSHCPEIKSLILTY